jgi:hypothetical protein
LELPGREGRKGNPAARVLKQNAFFDVLRAPRDIAVNIPAMLKRILFLYR